MLIADTRDQVRRVAKQVEFVRHLKIGRERLFIEAAIDRIVGKAAIRRTRAVTSAVKPVDQIDHPFEIERAKALDHRRIVRNARSEAHTSEIQSLMRLSYADFCLKNK